MKNSIHAYLLMYNVKMDANPFTKDFIGRLKDTGDPKIDGYLHVIDALNEEIDKASEMIETQAEGNEYTKLLMTIPGISYYTALLIVSEIGDIGRFPDSYHLVSYAGLSPSTHSSGGNTYYGSITKQGSPYLRWALNQVTWAHIRNEPDGIVAKFYRKLAKKKRGEGQRCSSSFSQAAEDNILGTEGATAL
ncbi:MAG: transposase [Candidatus Parvarchaeota archaeon]